MSDTTTADAPSIEGASSDEVGRFRRILLGLAAVTLVGTAVELAMLRHWVGFDQLIPWFILAVVGVVVAAQWLHPTPAVTLTSRVVGVAAAVGGAYGAWEHIHANYESGPLDFRYAETWSTMSMASKAWTAATGGVGPAPALAPMILALSGACLALATVGLPTRRTQAVPSPA